MVKIEYWKCDRCGKELKKYRDISMMTIIGKTQEFCSECTEDFKIWYKNNKKLGMVKE